MIDLETLLFYAYMEETENADKCRSTNENDISKESEAHYNRIDDENIFSPENIPRPR